MRTVQLSRYDNSGYDPGRPLLTQMVWFALGLPLLRAAWLPFSGFRCWLLRQFGARIGRGGLQARDAREVSVAPGRRRSLLDWGGLWIDNLANVTIGRDCCLSQGSTSARAITIGATRHSR